MGMNSADESLYGLLSEVQLDQFAAVLSSKLQVTKLEHLANVRNADLMAVGMSQPAIRRFRAALKERRKTAKCKSLKLENRANFNCSKNGAECSFEPSEDFAPFLIAESEIKLFEKIGEGSFGLVRRATWTPRNGRKLEIAAKVIHEDLQFNDDLRREITFVQQHRHPHLVRLLGVVLSSPVIIVTEFCEGGCLLNRLRQCSLPALLVSQLCCYARQLLSAMTYFEAKHLIHRDIAARNLLLKNDEKVVKLCDFGMVMQMNPGESRVASTTEKFPLAWCAPESLKFRRFSHASDVWSFAVCLWEMFTYGQEPWQDLSLSELFLYVGNCRELQENDDFLKMEPGDQIIVISGNAVDDYWYGQNMRTRKIGRFLRRAIEFSGRLTSCDISMPLPGSFVHTGHGDIRPDITWGYPDKIDKIFLRNPMTVFVTNPALDCSQASLSLSSSHQLDIPREESEPAYSDVVDRFLSAYELSESGGNSSEHSCYSGVSRAALTVSVNSPEAGSPVKMTEKPYYDVVPNDPVSSNVSVAQADGSDFHMNGYEISCQTPAPLLGELFRLGSHESDNSQCTASVEGAGANFSVPWLPQTLEDSRAHISGSVPSARVIAGVSLQSHPPRAVPTSDTTHTPFNQTVNSVSSEISPAVLKSNGVFGCEYYALQAPVQSRRRRSVGVQALLTHSATSDPEPLMRFSNDSLFCSSSTPPVYSDSGVEVFDPIMPIKCSSNLNGGLKLLSHSQLQTNTSTSRQAVLDTFDPLSSRVRHLSAEPSHFAGRNVDEMRQFQECKVQRLMELGLGSRSACISALQKVAWDLDCAAWNLCR